MDLVTVALAFIVGTLYIFYKNRHFQINVFRTMGIPGPQPHWLTGNLTEYFSKPGFESFLTWERRYGRTFGYYEGPKAILVTSEPDIIKEVFVRQFSKFHGRKPFTLAPNPDTFPDVNMLMARGHRWKRLRSIVNPTFSAHKLKQVLPLMQKKIAILVEKFYEAAQQEEDINVNDYFGKMTLDVIGETAFGLEINSQHNPDEPFLKAAKAVFDAAQPKKRPLIFKLAAYLPEVEPYLAAGIRHLMARFHIGPFFYLKNTIHGIIKQRKQEDVPRADLLQLMLDAEASEADVSDVNMWEMRAEDDMNKIPADDTEEKPATEEITNTFHTNKSKRKLTNSEIGNQSTVFLLAGYETTSNVMAYLCYLLATNQQTQDTLLKEVDKYKDESITDVVGKMQYLDMCISETLRLYPVGAPVVSRRCMEDCHVAGYDIPEGMIVQSNSMALHYNMDIWGPTDTNNFYPERFLPENSSSRPDVAWLGFGAGPRNCVGMRFALMEAKHTMVSLLRRFSFHTCAQTQIPLKLREAGTISPADGIVLKVVMRH